jgi:hypothetical protein
VGGAVELLGASALFENKRGNILLYGCGDHTLNVDDKTATCRRIPVTKLTEEQRRALRLLARTPKGCTEAVLMAHGCPIEMLEKLVMAGPDANAGNGRRRGHG